MPRVFVKIAGVWVSGDLLSQHSGTAMVNLCTGDTVVVLEDEIRHDNPRIDNDKDWAA